MVDETDKMKKTGWKMGVTGGGHGWCEWDSWQAGTFFYLPYHSPSLPCLPTPPYPTPPFPTCFPHAFPPQPTTPTPLPTTPPPPPSLPASLPLHAAIGCRLCTPIPEQPYTSLPVPSLPARLTCACAPPYVAYVLIPFTLSLQLLYDGRLGGTVYFCRLPPSQRLWIPTGLLLPISSTLVFIILLPDPAAAARPVQKFPLLP